MQGLSNTTGLGSGSGTPFRIIPYLTLAKHGAACTLIEVGALRILLDCGAMEPPVFGDEQRSNTKATSVSGASGGGGGGGGGSDEDEVSRNPWLTFTGNDFYKQLKVDVILLTHADKQHMGALPVVFSANIDSNDSTGPLVLCTLPVLKFGHLVLYDLYMNRAMESSDETKSFNMYNLDDIDRAFSHIYSFKFHEAMPLAILSGGKLTAPISFCPMRCGRTVGGAIWHLKYETTDICYAADIFELNDKVVDGIETEYMPKSSILISESGGKETAIKSRTGAAPRADKLIDECLVALRWGGNVLVPCESSGRILDFLFSFNDHWNEFPQLKQYKIVFLSHMARNINNVAKSCLEWFSSKATKKFFDGKKIENPFEFNNISFCSSALEMAEVEKSFGGTGYHKIVFVTDSSLNYGLSKDMLLRWAENPKSRIIFTDSSPPNSIADLIRKRAKSVVAGTNGTYSILLPVPERIPLEGNELEEFLRDKQRLLDEAELRKLTEANLKELRSSDLQVDSDSEDEGGAAAAEDTTSSSAANDSSKSTLSAAMQVVSNSSSNSSSSSNSMLVTPLKGETASKESDEQNLDIVGGKRSLDGGNGASTRSTSQQSATKRSKVASEKLSRAVIETSAIMFQNKEEVYKINEYGISNDDLSFKNIDQVYKREMNVKSQTFMRSFAGGSNNQSSSAMAEGNPSDEVHYKTVSTWKRIDVSCDVKEDVSVYGNHADTTSLKGILARGLPAKLVLLPSNQTEVDVVARHCITTGVSVIKSEINCVTDITLMQDKIKLFIPHNQMSQLQITLEDRNNDVVSSVSVFELKGCVEELKDKSRSSLENDGVRSFVLKPVTAAEAANETKERDIQLALPDGEDFDSSQQLALHGNNNELGTVALSLGEISFDDLKKRIESKGIKVDISHVKKGFLLCDAQVAIKKEENGFVIEGPPSRLYDTIRTILYEKFAFL